MHTIYLATTFAAAIVFVLTSLLLFLRRKEGERSRIILSVIILFSAINYTSRFVALTEGVEPELVVSGAMLLVALFMSTSYIIYPLEVISPDLFNVKRIFLLYTPCLLLGGVYQISLWMGVEYTSYHSLLEMPLFPFRFDHWFRWFLCILVVAPLILLFTIPKTKRYSNIDRKWMSKYTGYFLLNALFFLLILLFNNELLKAIYYFVSAFCSLGISYMELFDRIIVSPNGSKELPEDAIASSDKAIVCDGQASYGKSCESSSAQTHQLDEFAQMMIHIMEVEQLYKDPMLNVDKLAHSLCSNRTRVAQSVRRLGYESTTNYINQLRIQEFIRIISTARHTNYQDAFYEVGFRDRTTAYRNFRQIAGVSPSDYFHNTVSPSR